MGSPGHPLPRTAGPTILVLGPGPLRRRTELARRAAEPTLLARWNVVVVPSADATDQPGVDEVVDAMGLHGPVRGLVIG